MAGFTSPYVAVVTLAVAAHLVVAVPPASVEHVETSARGTLHRSNPSSVVRREQDQATTKAKVQLSPDGQTRQDLAEVQSHNFKTKDKTKEDCPNFCNKNYVVGDLNFKTDDPVSYCDPSQKMTMIDDPAKCREAAEQFCPDESCIEPNFEISDEDFINKMDHPERCFFRKTSKTWWYNPTGGNPNNATMCADCVPVCEKPEYDHDTNDTKKCHEDYEEIMNEDGCRLAARCLMFCSEEQFHVLPESTEENLAPKGCHMSALGCVKFNNITGEPAGPIAGYPICKLKIRRGHIMDAIAPAAHGEEATAAAPAPA